MAATVVTNLDYARCLARAFGGALLFSFPLLMTMEMWSLGLHMDRPRLLLFVLLGVPLIWGLSRHAGFRPTSSVRDEGLDAFSALGVGFLTSAGLLALLGVLSAGQTLDEMIGKIALQTIPAAMGAVLARKQLAEAGADAQGADAQGDAEESWPAEMFLMAAGAVFVALNVAPTEEMRLIAYLMAPWQALVLTLASIALLHAVVYSLGFAGQHDHDRPLVAFAHFTVPGYALVLAVALYIQWTFGHLEGHGPGQVAMTAAVIGFPAALGAGAARLLV